jgi:hypothetical protein
MKGFATQVKLVMSDHVADESKKLGTRETLRLSNVPKSTQHNHEKERATAP